MNMRLYPVILGLITLSFLTPLFGQDMDAALAEFAEKIAAPIKEHGKKKVTVLDFTDLQGGASELGKYIAEQLTVNLVMGKRDFAVLDRANLKSILAEHKLTSQGLIDPANAKKLGEFAGVDALILGNIIPKGGNVSLTAKVITTDTAEIVGAARTEFKSDETVKQFLAHPVSEPSVMATTTSPEHPAKPKIVKSFGDLNVELQSLKIVGGYQLLLTMTLTNKNPAKPLALAIGGTSTGDIRGEITDDKGNQYQCNVNAVSGLQMFNYQYEGMAAIEPATDLASGDSLIVTVRFSPRNGARAFPGPCTVQLQLFSAPPRGRAKLNNLVAKIDSE